jgi:hypothetical protein
VTAPSPSPRGEWTELYAAHLRSPFPPRLRTTDPAGIDLVRLDADVTGCASIRAAGGPLDDRRRATLRRCRSDLAMALPLLTGGEATYFLRLDEVAAAALE